METAASGIGTYASLLQRMRAARALSDEIFAIVRPEALHDRPIPERQQMIFYLGHLEAFDWNLLNGRLFDSPAISPEFDKLFASDVTPGSGLPGDEPKDWPARAEIENYGRRVRETVDERLGALRDDSSERGREAVQLLNMAIEYRLMQVEDLSCMLHQLPIDRKYRRENAPAPEVAPRTGPLRSINLPKGIITMGLRQTDDGTFGWDNEFKGHTAVVPMFVIDENKVTNGEFLRFVRAGGYRERSFWSEEDWNWVTSNDRKHPGFWVWRERQWNLRTMFDEVPLPVDWPVYVSHAEASAYARWAGLQLPSEAEFQRAAYAMPQGTERAFPWGNEPPEPRRGNFNFERWDPAPTGAYSSGLSAYGVGDLLGNGWEWTRTVFAPFEGFEPSVYLPGYSTNCFDGKHYVLKGGSARTARCLLRRSFRRAARRHDCYLYASFRCVEANPYV